MSTRILYLVIILSISHLTIQDDSRYKLFEVHEMDTTSIEDSEFLPGANSEHIFTFSLRPEHKVINLQQTYNMKPKGVAADHPVATAFVFIMCVDIDDQPCEVELDIRDSLIWEGVLYKKTRNQFILKVNYFEYYKFYYVLTNQSKDKEILVTASIMCEKCGRANHKKKKYLDNDKIEKKHKMLEEIKRDLNVMSILTVKTKAMVNQFTKNATGSERWVLIFLILECVSILLVGVTQVYYIKRYLKRKNII